MSAQRPSMRLLRGVRNETMETIFAWGYAVLACNALLIVFNAPLAVMMFALEDPFAAWPLLLASSLTLAPSITGVFGVLKARSTDQPTEPFRQFWSTWRRNFFRAFAVGLVAGALVFITLTVAIVFAGTIWVPLLGPTLAVIACLALSAVLFSCAGFALFAEVTFSAIVKAAIYLAAKRWYFSAMSLALCAVIIAAVTLQPVLGAAIVPGVLLVAIWGNAHFSFVKVVETAR